MKRTVKTIGAFALLATLTIAIYASVTFDPETGFGFVGKGDVQLAYGWNNAVINQNAGGISFSYVASEEYTAVCTFVTGSGTPGQTTHNVPRTRTTDVNSSIALELRNNKLGQLTGFNLIGLGNSITSGDAIPVVGGGCAGGPNGGSWTSVELTSSTGGLQVHYNGGVGTPIS